MNRRLSHSRNGYSIVCEVSHAPSGRFFAKYKIHKTVDPVDLLIHSQELHEEEFDNPDLAKWTGKNHAIKWIDSQQKCAAD